MINRKQKVLYISYLGILEAIPKSQVLPYICGLSENYAFHLLTFEKQHLLKEDKEEFKRLNKIIHGKNINWHILKYHKWPYVISSIFDILAGTLFSIYIIIRYKISIVHARSNIPIAIGLILSFLFKVKVLYDRRGIMGEDHTEHSGWNKGGFLYRFSIWFEKIAFSRSNAVVVLTDSMKNQLNNCGRIKKNIPIETIPCCVDTSLFHVNETRRSSIREEFRVSNKFVFAYCGSVGTYNLLQEMFQFMESAKSIMNHVHFLLVTWNKERVDEFLKKNKHIDRKNITVMQVLPEKIPSLLSMADAGLVFRRISPTAIAASPTKFSEYLASGLPVISAKSIGDLGEIITRNKIGSVLKSYDSMEYKKAVNNLKLLFESDDDVKKRCRKVAEDIFSLDRGIKKYKKMYSSLESN